MANFFNTPFSTFIRGAQTTIHEWQMMLQSLKQTFFAGLVIVAVLSVWQVFEKTSEQDRYVMKQWVVAGFKTAFMGPNSTFVFVDKTGRPYTLYSGKYLKSNMAKSAWIKAYNASLVGLKIGLALSSLIILIVLFFFYYSGRKQGKDFHVRGAQLGTTGELVRKLKEFGRKGTISVGGIRLPADMEPTNIALVGSPRVGKSVEITEMLRAIRKAGQRAIIYDYGGLYIRLFYREGKDIILNPNDERSAEWRPWYDAHHPAHYEQQAASLVPDDKSVEDFWPKAARTVYVALARKLQRTIKTPTLHDLLYWGLQQNADDVAKFLRGTEATSAFGKDRTAFSIMSHLATYLKALNYLKTNGDPFSIRKWVTEDNDDSWLFISTNEEQIESVRPLISLWIDIATSAILSLPEDHDRRIWYIFDELTTLQALPTLLKALTNAPKFGGCGVIGYQSKPLLERIYKNEAAAALVGGCATHCIFRANDVETAKWAQESLGETEVAETNEGISYGVTKLRDGRTASINRTVRPLVLASEVRGLKKFQYFLSMGSGLPIVPIQQGFKAREAIASEFQPNSSQKLVVDQGCERFEQVIELNGDDTISPAENVEEPLQPSTDTIQQSSSSARNERPVNVKPGELPLSGGKGRKPYKRPYKKPPATIPESIANSPTAADKVFADHDPRDKPPAGRRD